MKKRTIRLGIKLLLRSRLSAMFFLEFAVWGAYLTSIGNYMGSAGMGGLIPWVFAIQGLVCLFTPPLVGYVADRFVPAHRLLSLCHLGAGAFMLILWELGSSSLMPDRTLFILFFTLSSAMFMPTVALCGSIALRSLRLCGKDTVGSYPAIRMMGTVGFIAAMVFVNCAAIQGGTIQFSLSGLSRIQYQCSQFLVSGVLSLLLMLYCYTLPHLPVERRRRDVLWLKSLGFDALSILRSRNVCVFFIFACLMGFFLKITNAYVGPYLTSFLASDGMADTFGAKNATLIASISQVSEAMFILLIPWCMRRYGIKVVLTTAIVAWMVRFATLGLGNTGSGMWLIIVSMIVYGVAFDFFNIAGSIYLEQVTDSSLTASAQGLLMTMSNGLGASIGTIVAGQVIDYFCSWTPIEGQPGHALLLGDWTAAWLSFAAFAALLAVSFMMLFRSKR